ncbi:glycoside hydrolase N-terminal domain-containing protein [candidate division KSB1 bacterium]|nr:glycoside hydrolase N-terminal domain-containing protein [candidate division KSB1 bacterium]
MRSFIIIILLFAFSQIQAEPSELKIWFDHPAKEWNEALPVGNGRLGAMVFGGVRKERLQLNEETVWTGAPIDVIILRLWERFRWCVNCCFWANTPRRRKWPRRKFWAPGWKEGPIPISHSGICFWMWKLRVR